MSPEQREMLRKLLADWAVQRLFTVLSDADWAASEHNLGQVITMHVDFSAMFPRKHWLFPAKLPRNAAVITKPTRTSAPRLIVASKDS